MSCAGDDGEEAEVIGEARGDESKSVGELEARESEICESKRERIERYDFATA